jgi:hypothetical protein
MPKKQQKWIVDDPLRTIKNTSGSTPAVPLSFPAAASGVQLPQLSPLIICDLDDTLCYPSPYQQLLTIEAIEAQHQLAQTRKFKQALLDAPLAPWVTDNRDLLDGEVFIATGRWCYQHDETVAWLAAHAIKISKIFWLSFDGWDSYFYRKRDLILNLLRLSCEVWIIDDDIRIIEWCCARGLPTVHIKDGEIAE